MNRIPGLTKEALRKERRKRALRYKRDLEWAYDNVGNPLAEAPTEGAARFRALAEQDLWTFFDCCLVVDYWASGDCSGALACIQKIRLEKVKETFRMKKLPGEDGADLPLRRKNWADLGARLEKN
jgi:hypothetical protein